MLIFGPYRAIPKEDNFIIFNLTSLNQSIPRLQGLFVTPNIPYLDNLELREQYEKDFDLWYMSYVLEDPIACSSLMAILNELYSNHNVYICISDYSSDPTISMINESFMKILQQRYDIEYSIINEPEDYYYIKKDGCAFQSIQGIQTFDMDRIDFLKITEVQKIRIGGGVVENY